jgi:hypothetical protein
MGGIDIWPFNDRIELGLRASLSVGPNARSHQSVWQERCIVRIDSAQGQQELAGLIHGIEANLEHALNAFCDLISSLTRPQRNSR